MTFYKKITNYLSNDIRIKKYYIFDKPIFEKISRKVNGLQKTISKRISFSKSFNPYIYIYIYKKIYTPPLPPFYLKVNRITDDTFMYIQRWVDVAIIYGADIYFICDKKELETLILQKIYFRNARSINFIKSDVSTICVGMSASMAAFLLAAGKKGKRCILPNADVKIFLTASAEERARRRYLELQSKGDNTPYDVVLADIKERDYRDTHRDIAPLKQAEDAVYLDTSNMTIKEAAAKVVELAKAAR